MSELDDIKARMAALEADNLRLRTQGLSEADRARVLAEQDIAAQQRQIETGKIALAEQAKQLRAERLSLQFRIPVEKLMTAPTAQAMDQMVIDMTGALLNDPKALQQVLDAAKVTDPPAPGGDAAPGTPGAAPGAAAAPATTPTNGATPALSNEAARITEQYKDKGGDSMADWLSQVRVAVPAQGFGQARPQYDSGAHTAGAALAAPANTPAAAPASAPAPAAVPA